ncbi:MAG TPA: TM0106 family RecB-like putative nuclease, partial [Pyrinomonadaceae bacterium]|nr:TM0106 family RecB-like putative nuclease [Pyrinomonadaceae bacterium]
MFSPTSIANFLACTHLITLNRAEAAGEIKRPFFPDPGLELLIKLGVAHEEAYLRALTEERKLDVVKIETEGSRQDAAGSWQEAAAQTIDAMRSGAGAIYQATFLTDEWRGRADFLIRVDKPSELGPWSYEVVETKLAKSTKARAIIQLCFYSELVAAIQGKLPERMHVVLGRGAEPEEFLVQRYISYFRKIKREFEAALATPQPTYPEPVEHCDICDWYKVCDEQWHTDDHLSLVANITRNQRQALVEREVGMVAKLATLTLPVTPKMKRVAPAPLLRIREQARVQVRGREEGGPVYEFIEEKSEEAERVKGTAEGKVALRGLAALPLPSLGDVFLDFEGDPFAFEQGLEYLIGTVRIGNDGKTIPETTPNGTNEDDTKEIYEAIWSFNPAEEKKAFEKFIAMVMERRLQYPDMHIYHYAPYEPTAIKHLSGRHNVCTDEVDELLRAEVFVDLFRIVRQGLRASVESYSIKKMEDFYGFKRIVPLRDATSSLQAFETVLALAGKPEDAQEILNTIADYNRDDCVSTLRLREWLEPLRRELEAKLGTTLPRPELKSGAAS